MHISSVSISQPNQTLAMGKRREKLDSRSSQTLPPSPSHSFSSSSSSDFEFTISLSPRKSSPAICPADELFYKGQLLPLHLSPRISMVRTLLLASSSTSSSSDATTTASRDSTGSTSSSTSSSAASSSDLLLLAAGDCDSSRPSSVADELADEFKRLTGGGGHAKKTTGNGHAKYFSLSRFSSVFKKDSSKSNHNSSSAADNNNNSSSSSSINHLSGGSSSVKRMSTTAKEVIRKYLKKVKPLYEKLSHKQKMGLFPNDAVFSSGEARSGNGNTNFVASDENKVIHRTSSGTGEGNKENSNSNTAPVRGFSHSFSGNLKYPRKRGSNNIASSCPSSMRSSPSHSGVLSRSGASGSSNHNSRAAAGGGCGSYGDASSMEELQSAIQGAIAHCKNSMIMPPPQGKGIFSNEI